jgi:phage terminase small subunit
MTELTDRRELFCREYLADLNATQAVIRAGYSPKNAGYCGNRLLDDPDVKKRIAELMDERNEVLNINSDYVLRRLEEIDKLDIADILDADGNVLPVGDWPHAWRTSVGAIEIAQVHTAGETTSCLKKVKLPDKLRNLELLGKHTDVSAFANRMEITGKDGKELVIQVRKGDLIDSLKGHVRSLKKNLSK